MSASLTKFVKRYQIIVFFFMVLNGIFSITLHLLYCTFKQLSATEYSKSDRKNLLDFYYFLPVGNWLRKLLGSDLYLLALGFVSCQMAIQWSIHSNLSHLLLFRESPILSLALALSTGCPSKCRMK